MIPKTAAFTLLILVFATFICASIDDPAIAQGNGSVCPIQLPSSCLGPPSLPSLTKSQCETDCDNILNAACRARAKDRFIGNSSLASWVKNCKNNCFKACQRHCCQW